jgi:hypothetical protein
VGGVLPWSPPRGCSIQYLSERVGVWTTGTVCSLRGFLLKPHEQNFPSYKKTICSGKAETAVAWGVGKPVGFSRDVPTNAHFPPLSFERVTVLTHGRAHSDMASDDAWLKVFLR